jgi:BirA family biotin operon repressor/biotin-[acetyl-CoA-carboxylase] ligase
MTPGSDPPIIDAALLHRLLSLEAAATVQDLARQMGSSAVHVQAELRRLGAAGCQFERHPHSGVRLLHTGLGAWVDYLRHQDARRTRLMEVYRRTSSTQDAARRLIDSQGHAANGAIVAADEQTAGRGRLGRRWVAPSGSALTFSRASVRRTGDDPLSVDRLTFATAVAVAVAIEQATAPQSVPVRIKWPNDLYVDGRKLAGILVETHQSSHGPAAIVGVGINVAMESADLPPDDADLRGRVTSLAMLGRRVDRLSLLAAVIRQMDHAIDGDDVQALLDQWRQRSLLMSRQVELTSNGQRVRGQVVDLDPWHGLIVRSEDGALLHLPAATTTMR